MDDSQSPDQFLEDAAGRTPADAVTLTIRELIWHWGAKRRGYWIVDKIKRDLKRHHLTTDPPFTEGWIDNTVRLLPEDVVADTTRSPAATIDDADAPDKAVPEVSLQVSSLGPANLGVTSVKPEDSLQLAQTLMMRHDYSQLAVLAGERDLRGAVSWESIAQAHILSRDATLKDAIVAPTIVREDDDLLTKIPLVVDAGYVFVQARDRRIAGIVTTADLSEQFATLAKPFFMLAEIERRLRRIIDTTFSKDELQNVVDPADSERTVESADDLTLGEYRRLLEEPSRWIQLRWSIDRVVFIRSLDDVRNLRNEVMHFSPDPLDDDQVNSLATFRKWLRHLDPLE